MSEKLPTLFGDGRSGRTENDFLLEGFGEEHHKKERTHRNAGFVAYDEASGEHPGTTDPLGGAKWTPQLWARSCASSAKTVG